jgi:Spy/CpxP family protein refolding chaperone
MMGPGMMGPGMMGPGMMGPGMMGPGMMGPGMMGPGMMGPGMFGPGMMAGMSEALNLTDDQQKKLDGIAEDSQAKMYDLMKEMRAERFRLQELYYADEPDTAAISKQMKKISDLQQKMFDLQLDARSRMQGVLTKEQAAEMKRWRHRWMMGG